MKNVFAEVMFYSEVGETDRNL